MATTDHLNPILDELVLTFAAIDADLTGRGFLLDMTGGRVERAYGAPGWAIDVRPYIGVDLDAPVAVTPLAAGGAGESFTWRCEGTILVYFVLDVGQAGGAATTPTAGVEAAVKMVQDLMRAIALDVNLNAKVISGMIGPGSFEVGQDLNNGALLGGGTLELPVTWEWQT